MNVTSRARLLCSAFLLTIATCALAAAPQQRISGPGSHPIDVGSNYTIMNLCPGPVAGGWGVYDAVGWRVAFSFIPSVTAVPSGMMCAVSNNGFSSLTLAAAIYTDAGSGVPGTLLFQGPPTTVSAPPTYPAAARVRLNLQGAPTLTAGTSYIMVLRAPVGACFVDSNSGSCPGTLSQSLDGGVTWTLQPGSLIRGVFAP